VSPSSGKGNGATAQTGLASSLKSLIIRWQSIQTICGVMRMKIVSIRVHVLQSPLAQPFAFSQGWVHRRSATLI